MQLSQYIMFYFIGLLAFFAIGYIFALIQSKGWSDERKQKSLNFQRGIVKGKISEQLAPYLPDFPSDLKPSEAKFIGDPIDFIVFKGSDERNISEVVFVEVKAGKGRWNSNENSLRDAITQKRVRYVPYHVPAELFAETK